MRGWQLAGKASYCRRLRLAVSHSPELGNPRQLACSRKARVSCGQLLRHLRPASKAPAIRVRSHPPRTTSLPTPGCPGVKVALAALGGFEAGHLRREGARPGLGLPRLRARNSRRLDDEGEIERDSWSFSVFEVVGNHAQGERLRRGQGLFTGCAVHQDSRQIDNLRDPASIRLSVKLYRESHGGSATHRTWQGAQENPPSAPSARCVGSSPKDPPRSTLR